MGLRLSGCAASQNIDSSGETLDLAGLDISTLVSHGVVNFEHKSDTAEKIVGKVIFAKKIFSEQDCENEDQKYFFDMAKSPYLYAIVELFDDVGHSGAEDVAALARYQDKMFRDNRIDFKTIYPLIGWSIEGSTLNKEKTGVITDSLARKIATTVGPCNKVCYCHIYNDEMAEKPVKKKSRLQEILGDIMKSEDLTLEQSALIKSDVELFKSEELEKQENHVTQSGKPISMNWNPEHNAQHKFSSQDHKDASNKHYELGLNTTDPSAKQLHFKMSRQHLQAANSSPWSSKRTASVPKESFTAQKPHIPTGTSTPYVNIPGSGRGMEKTESAGAPASLTGMGAVATEQLDKKMVKSGLGGLLHMSEKKPMKKQMLMIASEKKLNKSEEKPEELPDVSVPTWEKVELFKNWIAQMVPSLTPREAKAFARAFKVFQIKKAEKTLKDL